MQPAEGILPIDRHPGRLPNLTQRDMESDPPILYPFPHEER